MADKEVFVVSNPETGERIKVTVETLRDSNIAHPSRTSLQEAFVGDLMELNNSGWEVDRDGQPHD